MHSRDGETHTKCFDDFVIASVAIKSSPEILYQYLADIENLSQFFPQIEFKLDSVEPMRVGSVYYTRQKGAKNWTTYRILTLEKNHIMSAELVGKNPLFKALRYEHKFVVDGDKTISHERIDYAFRFGILGRMLNFVIGKKLVKKQVLDAHLKLRQTAEQRPVSVSNN